MYWNLFIKTWKNLRDNLNLLLPDIFFVVFMFVIGFLILNLSGLWNDFLFLLGQIYSKEIDKIFLIAFIKDNLLKIFLDLIIFIVSGFFIGASFIAMKYGMMKDVVQGKKSYLRNGLKYTKEKYWNIIGVKILIFLIFIIPSLILFILFLIILALIGKSGIIIFSIIGFLVALIYFIILGLALYFIYPIMFIKNLNAINSIKESFKYFRKNVGYVIVIFLIIFLVSIVLGLITYPISLLSVINYLVLFVFIIRILINLVIHVWVDLFRFNAYKKGS